RAGVDRFGNRLTKALPSRVDHVGYVHTMRSAIILAFVLVSSSAFAGPPPVSHYDVEAVVPDGDGVWIIGVDNCDDGGPTGATEWRGTGPRPKQRRTLPSFDEKFIESLPDRVRERMLHADRSGDLAYVVGTGGMIETSTDGTKTWTVRHSGTSSDLDRVVIASSTVAYAVGAKGTLLVTRDAGRTWKSLAIKTKEDFTSVFAVDDDIYVGGEQPFASHDRGKTWTKIGEQYLLYFGGTARDLYAWGFRLQ